MTGPPMPTLHAGRRPGREPAERGGLSRRSAARARSARRGRLPSSPAAGRRVRRRRRPPSGPTRRATRARRARRGTSSPSGADVWVPLNTFGKFERISGATSSPTTVTSSRPSSRRALGRDVHAAAVGGAVADRDEPRVQLVRFAVDGEAERMRLVDGERAQHRRDVERGARERAARCWPSGSPPRRSPTR